MSIEKDFTLDFSDFEKGFEKFVNGTTPKALNLGLFNTGNKILKDAKEKVPKAPWKLGKLHGSARVGKILVTKQFMQISAGFNIEYAARWHELPKGAEKNINWTTPGSGRKYLETKLYMFKDKYMWMIAETWKRAFK